MQTKEALFASAGGVEVSAFLGGDTRQATRGARRWSSTILEVEKIKLYRSRNPQKLAGFSFCLFSTYREFFKMQLNFFLRRKRSACNDEKMIKVYKKIFYNPAIFGNDKRKSRLAEIAYETVIQEKADAGN
ncbi:hypothetical protein G3A_17160 [Bacillus sp. 17376]|nr:hypothetical protein G3A_17160 [Bacillus sp. 17376]